MRLFLLSFLALRYKIRKKDCMNSNNGVIIKDI